MKAIEYKPSGRSGRQSAELRYSERAVEMDNMLAGKNLNDELVAFCVKRKMHSALAGEDNFLPCLEAFGMSTFHGNEDKQWLYQDMLVFMASRKSIYVQLTPKYIAFLESVFARFSSERKEFYAETFSSIIESKQIKTGLNSPDLTRYLYLQNCNNILRASIDCYAYDPEGPP